MHDYERYARHYDQEYDALTDDLPMYVRFAREQGDCLELGCGTARCAIAVAASGIPVVGLDSSPRMLELARAKTQRAGVEERVDLQLGDMCAFSFDRAFGLVTIPFGTLMCLDARDDQRATVRCAARHLRPGGRLVIDVFNPDVGMPDPAHEGRLFVCCTRTHPSGEAVLHVRSFVHDRAAQVLAVTDIYRETDHEGASTHAKFALPLHYLRLEQLTEMATAAGLSIAGVYGTYDLEPFAPESPRMVLVAER
jgi:SAM-dependent methyltransferase